MEMLHSFEYDEAEKVFARIVAKDPKCAMAYWGVAMSNFHALWSPPTKSELEKGSAAIAIAKSINDKSARETAYINAIDIYYHDNDKLPHLVRCKRFEAAMEVLHRDFPSDKEAAILYALALDAAADPTDKQFKNQLKAGELLNSLYPGEPNHPGIAHYLIHTYDYPGLAIKALPMARRYATIAPSSAHALHMPSHIFTRLGLWEECIKSNLEATASGKCYAESVGLAGHWDEELHGMDYLMYGYLQSGQLVKAKGLLDYLKNIDTVAPVNFKVAYAYASIPARYALETKNWQLAAALDISPSWIPWKQYPWQAAITHFAKAIGAARINNIDLATAELEILRSLRDTLIAQKDNYKATQVDIQYKSAEAWIMLAKGKMEDAVRLQREAANMEDATEKHPVTPGSIIPARELLGDMLAQLGKKEDAIKEYKKSLISTPNRYNAMKGANLQPIVY
jgi:tetratricopeptide (TPR) repeat protein